MLTDILEEKFFSKTELSLNLVTVFEYSQEVARRNQERGQFVLCLEIAMMRFILKKIAIYLTGKAQKEERAQVERAIKIVERERHQREMTAETAYLVKLIKMNPEFLEPV